MKIINFLLLSLFITSCNNNTLTSPLSTPKNLNYITFEATYVNLKFDNNCDDNYELIFKSSNHYFRKILADEQPKNVIAGDKFIVSYTGDLHFLESYPSQLHLNGEIKSVQEERLVIQEFTINIQNTNEYYLINENKSYFLDLEKTPLILEASSYLTGDYNNLYEGMILYASLVNNYPYLLYTYNPRLDSEKTFSSNSEYSFTYLEKDKNIGLFANNNYLIKTEISNFNDLVIGNDYLLKFNSKITLIENYLGLQNIIPPISIELIKENKTDNIDITVYGFYKEYDGMPKVDENGNYDNSWTLLSTSIIKFNYTFENEIIVSELKELINKENSEGINFFDNGNLYSSYLNQKEEYILQDEKILNQDIILFINPPIIAVWM